jgi:hypothetical protein
MGLDTIERKIKKFLPLPGFKPCFLAHTTLNMIKAVCLAATTESTSTTWHRNPK